MQTLLTAQCIECKEPITLPSGVLAGEIVVCAYCSVEHEVLSLDPLILALAPEVEEDWGE